MYTKIDQSILRPFRIIKFVLFVCFFFLVLKCTDSDLEQCPLWAKEGECFKNPSWMLENCKKSCRIEACGKSISLFLFCSKA